MMDKGLFPLPLLVAAGLLAASLPAYAAPWSIGGYGKSHFTALDFPAPEGGHPDSANAPLGSVVNRIRLSLGARLTDAVHAEICYDFAPRVEDERTDPSRLGVGEIGTPAYRAADLDRRLYPAEGEDAASFTIQQNLDRAMLFIGTCPADIYLGRQAIAFGSAHVISPTDILSPFSYQTLDTEDRIGVDAVRVRVPVGQLSELDMGYVAGEDFEFEESACFLRGKLYLWQTDWALTAMFFREHLLGGIDLARAVGGAGVWFESAMVFDPDYFRLSVGGDYRLTGDLYGFVEYHFNGAGSCDTEEYLTQLTSAAYADGSVYLLGRHYVAPGLSWQVTPLITATAEVLWNAGDGSAYAVPSMEYNIRDSVYLDAGLFLGWGDRPGGELQLASEFGSYPDIAYTSFRVYY